ncbi:aldehyde dehydrogenase family protein [Candidatus Fermentibacteria bacterium]|nr:MAG: aldehyde dehydrogenase family protein [Candidatus Fermentibacteria bacterium]
MNVQDAKSRIFQGLGLDHLNSGVYCGHWMPVEGKKILESVSPIDGSILGAVAQGEIDDFEKILEQAKKSYDEWSAIPAPRRGEIVGEIGAELLKEKELLGLLVTLEVGKTLTEGAGEIQEAVDIANFAVGLSRQLYGLTISSERPSHRLMEQWHPLGTIGVITSFNFPAAVWAWNSLIAAVVGNVTVWKPSSSALLTAVATIRVANRVLERNNLPPIFFLASGSGRTIGARMTDDSRIALVSFTGSTAVGRSVGEKVAARFGKSILELGGNNCAIVTPEADLPLAVKGVAFGAMATAGQRCTSTRRALVHSDVYDSFAAELKRVYGSVKIGNPLEKDTIVGPLVDESAVKAYTATVKKATAQGGRILHGGTVHRVDGCENGFFVTPTIIEMDRQEGIVLEETFAPILYVMKYTDLSEAIQRHNAVPQGLSSAIFSCNMREAEQFLSAAGSDCGIVNVNTSTAGAEIGGAFGGEKETGGGRESGSDAWKFYARRQTATVNYGTDIPLSQGVEFPV